MDTKALVTLAALWAASDPEGARALLERGKRVLRDGYARDPLEATLAAGLSAAVVLHRVEKDTNPAMGSVLDAVRYVTQSMASGIPPFDVHTDAGKTLTSALLAVGPAMTSGILGSGRADPTASTAAVLPTAGGEAMPPPAAAEPENDTNGI